MVGIDVPEGESGFKHRHEFVYLPPIWFTGNVPPKLPAVMMIAGEFSNPTNWIRTGNAIAVIDKYAKVTAAQPRCSSSSTPADASTTTPNV